MLFIYTQETWRYHYVIAAVKLLCSHKWREDDKFPSLLLCIRCSLALGKRECGIRSGDDNMVDKSGEFLLLHKEEWDIYQKHVLNTINSKKDKSPELLPLISDIQLLRTHVLQSIGSILEDSTEELTGFRRSAAGPLLYYGWCTLQLIKEPMTWGFTSYISFCLGEPSLYNAFIIYRSNTAVPLSYRKFLESCVDGLGDFRMPRKVGTRCLSSLSLSSCLILPDQIACYIM